MTIDKRHFFNKYISDNKEAASSETQKNNPNNIIKLSDYHKPVKDVSNTDNEIQIKWECLSSPLNLDSIITPNEKIILIQILNNLPNMIHVEYLKQLNAQGVTLNQLLQELSK